MAGSQRSQDHVPMFTGIKATRDISKSDWLARLGRQIKGPGTAASMFTSSRQKKETFRSSEGSRGGSGKLSPFDPNLLSD